tara:strand:+ start:543 stop:887 length:345 start_codon:yes stop_codon:yes gene_type:complete
MAYGIYDFEVEQGETFGLDITFTDEEGTLRQLANYEARIDIRTFRGAATATDTWNTGEEITVHDTAPNLRLTVPASKTAGYATGSYDYDLEVELAGVVEKLLVGKVMITGEATR